MKNITANIFANRLIVALNAVIDVVGGNRISALPCHRGEIEADLVKNGMDDGGW